MAPNRAQVTLQEFRRAARRVGRVGEPLIMGRRPVRSAALALDLNLITQPQDFAGERVDARPLRRDGVAELGDDAVLMRTSRLKRLDARLIRDGI